MSKDRELCKTRNPGYVWLHLLIPGENMGIAGKSSHIPRPGMDNKVVGPVQLQRSIFNNNSGQGLLGGSSQP